MGNLNDVKVIIDSNIKQNGSQDITGQKLNYVLNQVVDAVGVDLTAKQDLLVSGTNVKTINGQTILGSGDISIEVNTDALATKAELETLKNEVIDNEEVVAAALNDVRGYVDEQIANAVTNALNTEV